MWESTSDAGALSNLRLLLSRIAAAGKGALALQLAPTCHQYCRAAEPLAVREARLLNNSSLPSTDRTRMLGGMATGAQFASANTLLPRRGLRPLATADEEIGLV